MEAPKIIPNYPNYCLSDNGSVYNRKTKRTIKPSKSKCVSLYGNTSKRTVSISKLLREVFPPPEQPVIEQPVIDGRTTKVVPGFPDYTVSAMGDVYDRKRKCEQRPTSGGKIILVNREQRTQKSTMVAQLIAEVFIALPPGPYTRVRHLDGNKQNNRADNLRWVQSDKKGRKIDCLPCPGCGRAHWLVARYGLCPICQQAGQHKEQHDKSESCAIKTECLKGWEDIMVLVEQAMPKSNS